MLHDLRYAYRSLLKSPGFTAVAVLTLALGLAVNITVFGISSEFMLRRLPVRAPHELVFIMQRNPQLASMPFMLSYPDFQDMRARVDSRAREDASVHAVFAQLAAYSTHAAHISEVGRGAQRGWIHEVSDNYFRLLGVDAELGRLLLPGEGIKPGADAVTIISHKYWMDQFAGDPAIIGRKILINGAPFTIIGVTRRGFAGAEAMVEAQVFVPATMADELRPNQTGSLAWRGFTSYMVIARLQPTATTAEAQAAAAAMLQRLTEAYPNEHPRAQAAVIPEFKSRPSPFVADLTMPAIAALAFLSVLVLAVAAANITNLLYARAADAERSLAIRSALGASRARLVRQLLAESVLLAAAAGVVGWIAAQWFGALLQQMTVSAENPPTSAAVPLSLPVLFTAVAALVTGIATGIFPAWRATRLDVVTLLKEGSAAAGRARHPFRTFLVGGQIAVACIVLVCAGLALRSLRALSHVELGFRPDNVLLATFDLEMQRYTESAAVAFQRDLLQRVRALPGVLSAGLARSVPFDRNYGLRTGVTAEGYVPREKEEFPINCVPVSPGFNEALRIPLLNGRTFTDHDDENASLVAVVSRAVAEHFWPGQDPIGRNLKFDGTRAIQVVGLVTDLRYFMIGDAGKPLVFLPLAQQHSPRATLVVRTQGSPLALASSIEAIGRRLDPQLPIHNLTTFDNHIAMSPLGLMVVRFGTIIAATQAILVLLLSIMGLYGLIAFGVTRRAREIGIRMALGANQTDVVRLVTRSALLLTVTGLVVGLALAGLAMRAVSAVLYGSLSSVGVMTAVATLLLVVTLLACWLPARRATRINPVDTLRTE